MTKSSKRKKKVASPTGSPNTTAPKASTRRADSSSETPAQETLPNDLSRVEIVLVVVILALGIALRIAFPDRLAVEHFDEGVYASNLWFAAESGGQYPARQLYAPPLVPALIESSLLAEQLFAGSATRPSGLAAMFTNLLAGCLTLLIVWWVARTWFGTAAAIGTTTLAACSEFHALYSRTALTDVLLLLWMLLAVFLFERAVATRRLRLLLLAGLACGLAWWTKYNGWLPLLISLGGIILRLVFLKSAWRSIGRDLVYWVGFATLAAAVWSPVLWSLQATGGYTQVMANHRGYVVGLSGWWTSLASQLANLAHFDGWLSCLAPSAALLLVLVYNRLDQLAVAQLDKPRSRPDVLTAIMLAAISIALAAWCGLAVVLSYLAVFGLFATGLRRSGRADHSASAGLIHFVSHCLTRHQPRQVSNATDSGSLALWLVAAWFAGLFVLTPLYSPYPRLTLSWLCASWLAGGLGIAALSHRCAGGADRGRLTVLHQGRGGRLARWVLLVVSLAVVLFARQRVTARGLPAWQDRAGLRNAATAIQSQIDVQNTIVFVQGEPGLFYQLRAVGIVAVPGFDFNLSSTSLPDGVAAYLATGLHAQRSDEFQQQLARAKSRLKEVASYSYQPSDLVLLNNYRAQQLAEHQHRTGRVRLYRLK
ncbi:MAG TPA: glycosyltransferase family 39 protein [Pirellulaceae bacterium]|jgi:hypothetical protein|nr:glycosyltransferase family 39 protein [Pirellulaceae bacterium]